jgi:hypothetical protein
MNMTEEYQIISKELFFSIIDLFDKFIFKFFKKLLSGVEGLLEQATKWEASGEYAKAVDTYVKIMPSNTIDKETTLKSWMKVKEFKIIYFYFEVIIYFHFL